MPVSASAAPVRVLLAGKGPPDVGGIASLLSGLVEAGVPGVSLELLSFTRAGDADGGRLSLPNARNTLADAWRLARAARRAEIVHLHSALIPATTLVRAGFLSLAARSGGARVLLHAHSGRIPAWFATRQRRALGWFALSGATRVACVSRPATAALTQVLGPRRVVFVPNGVDTDLFHLDPADRRKTGRLRILFVGSLVPRKGVLDLIAASERLKAAGLAHELFVAGGSPPEGAEFEMQVRAAASSSAVRLLGAQPREAMPAVYRGADIFCLPSWWEGMPLSVLEAMACGLPVVASAAGEIPSVVEDGLTGFLVPPHDPERLAEVLALLLVDEDRRRSMGSKAREVAVARFDSRFVRTSLGTLYAQMAG